MFNYINLASTIWILAINFFSIWNIWNYFTSDTTIKINNISVNIIQPNQDKYIISDIAEQNWKTQKDISSLWFVEVCENKISKNEMIQNIINNKWIILNNFDNNKEKFDLWNWCIVYNIKNPWYNKSLNIGNFKNSKLEKKDDNYVFEWTDIVDITQRWYQINHQSINLSNLSWKSIFIGDSSYYLYWFNKNWWIVYQIDFDNIQNIENNRFNYLKTNYLLENLKNDWTFDNYQKEEIIYDNRYDIENNFSITEEDNYVTIEWKWNWNKKDFYILWTNYENNKEWIVDTILWKEYMNSRIENNDYDNILFFVSNKDNLNSSETFDIVVDDNKLIYLYFKKYFDFDNIYFYKDILNWNNYLIWIKDNNQYIFKIEDWNIYSCSLFQKLTLKDENSNSISFTWTKNFDDLSTIKTINVDEDIKCDRTLFVDNYYIKKLNLNKINKSIDKKITNNNFYIDDYKNNLNKYLVDDKDYISKNFYININNNWNNTNMLFHFDRNLDYKDYVVFVKQNNKNIIQIEYEPEKQFFDGSLEWDSHYNTVYDKNNPNYYYVITDNSTSENNIQIETKFKDAATANKYDVEIESNWFLKFKNNNYNSNKIISNFDFTSDYANSLVTIKIKDKTSWNIVDTIYIKFKRKVEWIVTTFNWLNNNGFLYKGDNYKELSTEQSNNVLEIWKLFFWQCKEINYNFILKTEDNIDEWNIYTNQINNSFKLDINNIKSNLKKIDDKTLNFIFTVKNTDTTNYKDNALQFMINYIPVDKNWKLQVDAHISCIKYDWSITTLNDTYRLEVIKNINEKKAIIEFYNPYIGKDWTILPLFSYFWKNWKTVIYKNDIAIDKDKFEQRMKIVYFLPADITNVNQDLPIQWLDSSYWENNWNSNHIFSDIRYKINSNGDKFFKQDNKYQYTFNNLSTKTKWIVVTSKPELKNNSVYYLYSEYLSPPVCTYITCWKHWCKTHYRYWERRRNYYINRNYNWNYYTHLLGWSLQTQNVDLTNIIKNYNIWHTYSYNKIINFSFKVNLPARYIENVDKYWNKVKIFSLFFTPTYTKTKIKFIDWNKIYKKINKDFDDYLNNDYKTAYIILNKKLQWRIDNAFIRTVTIGPCKDDFSKACYVKYCSDINWTDCRYQKDDYDNADWKNILFLTNDRFYGFEHNSYQNKNIFPEDTSAMEYLPNWRWIISFQQIYDVVIFLKKPNNINDFNSEAQNLLNNWGEYLLSVDIPINYVWQYTILGDYLTNQETNIKDINDLISFFLNISTKNYTTFEYWINIFKQYYTKYIDGYQKSQVITEKYYYWYHCSKIGYRNYIESKQFVIDSTPFVKMNLWYYYYSWWTSNTKYPAYLNDLEFWNNYNNLRKLIEKNLDYGEWYYKQQIVQVWNKIKTYWLTWTNNIDKLATTFYATKINTYDINDKDNFANNLTYWNDKYKINNLKDYLNNWKIFNKIIEINNNEQLNKLLFEWEDNYWNKLSTWITKIYVDYSPIIIDWWNIKWNVILYAKNWQDINILWDINKTNSDYFLIIYTDWNINIWNNVTYINMTFLIGKNIFTYYSANSLVIDWAVWTDNFVCNRNITSIFLLENSNNIYTNYEDLRLYDWTKSFYDLFNTYRNFKTAWCLVKVNYKLQTTGINVIKGDIWY